MFVGIRARLVIIEKLKYLNLEVGSGKIVNTKDNINIRCRINPSEDHSWHTSQSQLNLLVDLLYNFYITWGKRQDDLELKLEKLHKEHKQLTEQYSIINNSVNLALQILQASKEQLSKGSQKSDYIKEEVSLIYKKLDSLDKIPVIKTTEELRYLDQEVFTIKKLVEEVKTLVLS